MADLGNVGKLVEDSFTDNGFIQGYVYDDLGNPAQRIVSVFTRSGSFVGQSASTSNGFYKIRIPTLIKNSELIRVVNPLLNENLNCVVDRIEVNYGV